ncbi:Adenylate cyclase type 1 [Frankliniella fusca]|uniref:Adenylate cyclase type 1 n=1 Tax=Frankliniella fusca TaxID=407009 RepID=A0AAE1LPX1_9NEOP|nr:Adenylate cyclase type 1 [Frankliniella fusca]
MPDASLYKDVWKGLPPCQPLTGLPVGDGLGNLQAEPLELLQHQLVYHAGHNSVFKTGTI